MKTDFPKEGRSIAMQVFTPARVYAVVGGVEWTPGVDDQAFYATEEFLSVVITHPENGAQAAVRLPENMPWGIIKGATYTFTTNGTDLIVVM